MAIVLDGTAGITTPEITSAGGPLVVNASAPDNSVVVDTSGNVGIGTSSPPSFTNFRYLSINGTTGSVLNFKSNEASQFEINTTGSLNNITGLTNIPLTFGTNNTERARITSGGDFLLNTTSFTGAGDTFRWSTNGVQLSRNANGDQIAFFTASAFSGKISTSGTTTTYGTSSDYRLKHDITPMTGALEKVAQLKPVTYKWNADNSNGQGFIAHELQEVSPDCVVGEKDAVDAEGNPLYQTVDTSFLVATLTAAIQEQQALINAQQTALESLTARVVALEGQA